MQLLSFQRIFDTPSVKDATLNAKMQTRDGRTFEYLKASEAITKAMVVSAPANTDVDTVSSASDGASNRVFITEASAGWTVGDYQDHWGIVDDGTGEGETFKIKDNTADTLELYVEYALAAALAVADSDIVIRHEPDAEKVAITTLVTPVKGVAQVAFASADYGWFLKRGIGGVLAGEVITINVSLTPGDDTEGTAEIGDTAKGLFDETCIGRCLVANTTADEEALVDINIL